MQLVMTLLVRDEEDILKANIDYHLAQGVDFIIATDNKSTDSTTQILKSYEKKGKLLYILEEEDDYSQHKWVTHMARMACFKYKADWVINSDADEFWYVSDERSLKDFFTSVDKDDVYNVVRAPRSDFAPLSCLPEESIFYEHMVYRKTCSLNYVGKKVLPKLAHKGFLDVEVGQGNHDIYNVGEQRVLSQGLEILHFPVRSYEQFLRKIINGGTAYSQNTHLPERMGNEWRALYDIYKKNGDLKEVYKNSSSDEKELRNGMVLGDIVHDARLRDFFEKL